MTATQFMHWCKTFAYEAGQPLAPAPLVMGIVNVTPDSFSDGARYFSTKAALNHALAHVSAGADMIDIGGESSRPGATPLSTDDELARVIPVIQALRAESDICISVDTYKPEVMYQAAKAGANMVNDICGLASKSAQTCLAELNLPVCIMHMQGDPQTMQGAPYYQRGVVLDVMDFFRQRIDACLESGIKKEQLILDVGIGFGKTVQDNLSLIRALHCFKVFNIPLMIGVSRKHFIGEILSAPVAQRLYGSLFASSYAAMQGVAIIRTHDVGPIYEGLKVLNKIQSTRWEESVKGERQ